MTIVEEGVSAGAISSSTRRLLLVEFLQEFEHSGDADPDPCIIGF